MIKSFQQAEIVQIRRVSKNKRGYSKSVRRFLLKKAKAGSDYQELKFVLAVYWGK